MLNLSLWDPLEDLFGFSSPLANGVFSSETLLVRFAEAVVTSFGDRIEVDLLTLYFVQANQFFFLQKRHISDGKLKC